MKVIFVHFPKNNETVSFIKLLDFGLSQGRVSAVSIKCVVICSKFITFAVTKHPNYKYTADADPKNLFDMERYMKRHPKVKPTDAFEVYEINL